VNIHMPVTKQRINFSTGNDDTHLRLMATRFGDKNILCFHEIKGVVLEIITIRETNENYIFRRFVQPYPQFLFGESSM
jgi:hypothetical protein